MASIHDYEPLFGSWTAADDPLGRGAFGEVYEVHRKSMGMTQRAAVKRISFSKAQLDESPQRYELVKNEIQSMLDMKGAGNIVAIEEFTEVNWRRGHGKDILIRMELLMGLDSLLKKDTLPENEVVKLGIHICRALVLCEERNIIHRDIKPANIFKSPFGDYKLGDFGIARTLTDGKASTHAGTPGFIAPEVMYSRKYDLRADIYSLGITLYYMLNGNKLPFEDDGSDDSPIVRLLDGEPLPVLKASSWLWEVVTKACAHKPEGRYSSPKEMLTALENSGKTHTPPPSNSKDNAVVHNTAPSIHDYEPLFGSWIAADDPIETTPFGGEVYEAHRQSMGITQRAVVRRIPFSTEYLEENLERYESLKKSILSMMNMSGAANIVTIDETAEVNWKQGQGKDILIRTELLTRLDSLLKNEIFPESEIVKLGIHMCRALALCEERNLIHRNINPSKIFKSSYGDYKLEFFGTYEIWNCLADDYDALAPALGFTAPELMYGRKFDLRANIYSLGMVLYYMLNGNKVPFEDDLTRLLNGEPLPPLRASNQLWEIITKACAHKPQNRYSIPKEMLAALENMGRGPSPLPVPTFANANATEHGTPKPRVLESRYPTPKVGDKYDFGNYEWRVLEMQGRNALLLSEDAIEKRQYHHKYEDITWEKCTLRQYLNKEFLQGFSLQERDRIALSHIDNPDNLWYGTKGGNPTSDYIFLLSLAEVDKYFGDSGDYVNERREGRAQSRISNRYNEYRKSKGGQSWHLRSPGNLKCNAYVFSTGSIMVRGRIVQVDKDLHYTRPALWLKF